MEYIDKGICAPKGFKASGIHVGFRKNKRKRDLALVYSETRCAAAAVYTRNKVKSAPIMVNLEHLKDGMAQAIICNSGNANTCAPNGVEVATGACRLAAEALGIDEKDVIVCSTGVIGERMFLEPFEIGVPKAAKKLSYDGSTAAARAIMTTDKVAKEIAVSFEIDGKECRMGGIAKGSGMINPNMATMLCFITTDANVEPAALQKALDADILDTFNQISIDGDTSTNDTVALLANGMAGNAPVTCQGEGFDTFCQALRKVSVALCKAIAADGEGATKLLECVVSGAPDKDVARKVSKTVIRSDLVKTAIFGRDANWGRVLCAVGYSEPEFSVENVDMRLASGSEEVEVCNASVACDFDEEAAKRVLSRKVVRLLIDLNLGSESAIAYGCDLTYDYVRINGSYRT
ncbi:MAG: bifunctional glutamate N-acetyltransferase/amino-acid acetyltransferase ArgJ [Clostridiales Family XIII bacterium]|jgi:glutamate N-acetyltransferase/amino-acid N-acetyltransferase|nr:bifunctional glutamate N-acetyltransferase/amino-acid acetyltransferase ArgJ [Clostridiales Family XIII bacterium]